MKKVGVSPYYLKHYGFTAPEDISSAIYNSQCNMPRPMKGGTTDYEPEEPVKLSIKKKPTIEDRSEKIERKPLPIAYRRSDLYFIEVPSMNKYQLTDATRLEIHKGFAPDTRWEMLIRPFNAICSKEDKVLSYTEKIEKARKVFAPYRAFMIVKDTDDESAIAENFTNDSIIIVGNYFGKSKAPFSHHYVQMTKTQYLEFCYYKSADNSLTGRPAYPIDADDYNDTGWAYQFNRCADEIDSNFMNLYNTFNHSINSAESFMQSMYHTREYKRGKNHVHQSISFKTKNNKICYAYLNEDLASQDEAGETIGVSDKARAIMHYAKQDDEEVRFLKSRKKAIDEWLDELRKDGDMDKYNEVVELFAPNHDYALLDGRPTMQTCDCCGTRYDMLRYRCPICHSENDDCPMIENKPWIQNTLAGLDSTSTDNPY